MPKDRQLRSIKVYINVIIIKVPNNFQIIMLIKPPSTVIN